MRIALVHFWLVDMGGAERVLESVCRMFPEADIFTHCVRRETLLPGLRGHRIVTTFIDRLPFASRLYRYYLPLMPLALEQLDLRGYDLVISFESGPAKGVLVPSDVPHLCYCHTPMRYLWDMYPDYVGRSPAWLRPLMRLLLHRLRIWDSVSANRVDGYLANSATVARRIGRWWGREADVVHPPVLVPASLDRAGDMASKPYLFFSRLVDYKRADLAIRACASLGRPLVVAGDGPERRRLQRIAESLHADVSFVGRVDADRVDDVYDGARALVFPAEEDFGLIPVEALAHGCPVIAYGRGGVTETVTPDCGVFFRERSVPGIVDAILRFETMTFDPVALRRRAEMFSEARFRRELADHIDRLLKDHNKDACHVRHVPIQGV